MGALHRLIIWQLGQTSSLVPSKNDIFFKNGFGLEQGWRTFLRPRAQTAGNFRSVSLALNVRLFQRHSAFIVGWRPEQLTGRPTPWSGPAEDLSGTIILSV